MDNHRASTVQSSDIPNLLEISQGGVRQVHGPQPLGVLLVGELLHGRSVFENLELVQAESYAALNGSRRSSVCRRERIEKASQEGENEALGHSREE